jgi:hypothetical protein
MLNLYEIENVKLKQQNLLKFKIKKKFKILFFAKKYNVKFLLMYIFCLNIIIKKKTDHTFDELLKSKLTKNFCCFKIYSNQ